MAGPHGSDYFIAAVKSYTDSKCESLSLRKSLIKNAVRKNVDKDDPTPNSLLFPPGIIKEVLSRGKVKGVLGCECRICKCPPGGRERLSDTTLTDALTGTSSWADSQRRLFAALIYMGTGFATRRVCSLHTSGSELNTHQLESLREELFKPLQQSRVFSSYDDVTDIFKKIFEETMQIFDAPRLQIASFGSDLRGKNLPFINTVEMGNKADKSSFGRLFAFEIHPEFCDENIPAKLVRKELLFKDTHDEERRILEFLARCGQPNLIRLLFWYRFDNKINLVFPRYPSSLQQVLEGRLPEPDRAQLPAKYVGSKLQNWLWQGMVDVIAALNFFHSPKDPGLGLGLLVAAHFDLKPANVLVDDDGNLIVTDFGQARVVQRRSSGETYISAHVGDLNYQPPPLEAPVRDLAAGLGSIDEPNWSCAYDVWSMACIMTEVIEYITNGGPDGFRLFRESRRKEDDSSIAFWKASPEGGYELRLSVRRTLERFRSYEERYLNNVTNLLEAMFSIRPEDRPSLADCLAVILSDVRIDEWPFLDNEEISISDPGTIPQLRNMFTQFKREADIRSHRCKIYMLRNKIPNRIRLVVEFEKEIKDGTQRQRVLYVVSDSAVCEEEEYKLLSLFDPGYKPINGSAYLCAFRIVHPSLTFLFDSNQHGVEEYYHFLTAVTRQRCLEPRFHMPISGCRLQKPRLLGTKIKIFGPGHVQIWRELPEEEYYNNFTNLPTAAAPDSPTILQHQNNRLSLPSRRNSDLTAASFGSISSVTTVRGSTKATPRRLVVFLTGSPASCVTLNLTSKFNKIQWGLTANAVKSDLHVTIRAIGASFSIADLSARQGCPGIPLDPEVLESRETMKVEWVELAFKNKQAIDKFADLYARWIHIL